MGLALLAVMVAFWFFVFWSVNNHQQKREQYEAFWQDYFKWSSAQPDGVDATYQAYVRFRGWEPSYRPV